jgi:hypothetical protein
MIQLIKLEFSFKSWIYRFLKGTLDHVSGSVIFLITHNQCRYFYHHSLSVTVKVQCDDAGWINLEESVA